MWMSIVKEERDCLGRVLDRYQATGIPAERLDADVAWRMALGFQRPPVMPLPPVRRLVPIDGLRRSRIDRSVVARDAPPEHGEVATVPAPSTSAGVGARRRFRIVPDRSVLLVEIRSSVGPVNFGALGLTGAIDADLIDGNIRTATSPAAHVEIAMDGLRSGNRFYDAELLRRIDARRYPTATLTMSECVESGAGHRYRLAGDLTFHGVVRPLTGTVRVEVTADERLLVTGEEVFDIRDFGIPSPVVLMLRFYPDVKVHLHVEAELEET
jgi:hypothetical protein